VSSVDAFIAELASFEPRLYEPDQCVAVVELLARLENACAAARARTAARAAECGAHRRQGFVKPSDWLARATGSSTSEAERELDTAKRLDELPATREAVSNGELTLGQAHEVAETEAACPGSESEMLEKAKKESLKSLKEEGRKRRMAAVDPEDLARRQRDARFHRHWRDEHGMIRYSGAMVPTAGVPFMNRIDVETDREWRSAHRAGKTEPRERHAADAFAKVVSGGGAGHPVKADVVYVCDINSGQAHIVGGGPVPLATVDEVARDAFVKAVLHDGTQVDTVVHYGRKAMPAVVRTAVSLGDPPHFDGIKCVDCDRDLGLQWDHDDPVANGGPTTRKNLKPRCVPCHIAKTERDRLAGLLKRGRPRDPPP
jgi:hypothetical protein